MNAGAASRVRVVVVNYNAGTLLAECVARLAASTLPLDVVVVDNASSDGSLQPLRARLRPGALALHENAANLGFARAVNQGLEGWRGDYALLLNPDCLIEPDTLERLLAAMDARPGVGMAGCLIRNPDGSEQAGCRRQAPTPWQSLRRTLGGRGFDQAGQPLPAQPCPVEAISGAFMLVRVTALEAVGRLDEGYFLHAEDLDWCLRFRQHGWQVLFVPDVAVTHVKGASSRRCPICVEWHKHRGMARYYRKFFRRQTPWPLMGLVYAGIWVRFGVKSLYLLLAGPFSRRPGHAHA